MAFSSVEWADPKIEFVIVGGTAAGSWTGLAEMAEGFRNFLDAWEDLRVEPEEYRELDDERVLVLVYQRGRGKTSGLELGQIATRGAALFHIRAGTVTRLAVYASAERALADLGLADAAEPLGEQGPHSRLILQWRLPDGRLDRDGFRSLLHENVVWDMSRSPFPDARVYRGVEGVREWFEGLEAAFGDVVYEIERVREVGDQVAQLIHVHGRGTSSGIPVDYRFVPVMTLRAGKIVCMDRYEDWAEAMAALEHSG